MWSPAGARQLGRQPPAGALTHSELPHLLDFCVNVAAREAIEQLQGIEKKEPGEEEGTNERPTQHFYIV